MKGATREQMRVMSAQAVATARTRAQRGDWPANWWTPEQARDMGRRGGLRGGDHPNKLANLRRGPAAATAARAKRFGY